jgi:hypothetical protein
MSLSLQIVGEQLERLVETGKVRLLQEIRLLCNAPKEESDTCVIIPGVPEQDIILDDQVIRSILVGQNRPKPGTMPAGGLDHPDFGLFGPDPADGADASNEQVLVVGAKKERDRLNPPRRQAHSPQKHALSRVALPLDLKPGKRGPFERFEPLQG